MSSVFIQKRRSYLVTGLILVVIVLILLPIEFPYSLTVPGKIIPANELILQRQADGSLLSTLKNNTKNIVESYTAYQVERGDVLQFFLAPDLSAGSYVFPGDTIGYVVSNETERRIARLKGELATVQANLMLNLSGEKLAIIREAEDQLALSNERLQIQRNIHNRQEELYKQNLISLQNFEITRGTTRIYELEVTMAEAQLLALRTGSKPEQIEFIESEIQAKQDELAILRERLRKSNIRSTLYGRILNVFSQDTIFIIGDTASVVLAPVPVPYAYEISVGQTIILAALENGTGKVFRKGNRAEMINGRQVVLVAAVLNKQINVPAGLVTDCSIRLSPKTLWQHTTRILSTLFI